MYDTIMRASENPYLTDWFAISMRWLILIGLTISASLTGKLPYPILGALALPLAWNGFVSVLAIFNLRIPIHRPINLAIDSLAALLLFAVSGDFNGPLLWVAALVISSAAMYYEMWGAALSALIFTLLQAGYVTLIDPSHFNLTLFSVVGVLNLSMGLIIGTLSQPLIRKLRRTYQGLIRQRKESEQKVKLSERQRMQALFSMIETFSATLNYQTTLETAMNSSISTLGITSEDSDRLVCAFLLFQDGQLKVTVGKGFPAPDLNLYFPAEEGALSQVIKTGGSLVLAEPYKDPELNKLMGLTRCKTALILPLIRSLNAYGVLLYAHPAADFFTPERIELLEMVSNQAVIAIQNARLFQDLSEEKERILSTQEEAQKKLARDLHDGPTQSVSGIAMRINIARKLMERNPQAAVEELVKIEDLARRTTQEIRHMLFTLRPLVLESDGLATALTTMADKMRELYKQQVIVDADPAVIAKLDMNHQTVVFYLCEEALNNARKHAQASEIWVRLKMTRDPEVALLDIADNGLGFDLNSVMGGYEKRGSLGMINLQERTELINGVLQLDSAPGKGTRIRVYIPLSGDAIDRIHQSRRAAILAK